MNSRCSPNSLGGIGWFSWAESPGACEAESLGGVRSDSDERIMDTGITLQIDIFDTSFC